MIDIRETDAFASWFALLKDEIGRAMINARLLRLSHGAFGDVKAVGGGVVELRVHSGPGYRVYFVRRGEVLVVLLCGGDKASQVGDIARAKALAGELSANDVLALRRLGGDEP